MPDGPAPMIATTNGLPLADPPDTLRSPLRSADRDRLALGLAALGLRRVGFGLAAPPAATGATGATPAAAPALATVVPGAAVGLLLRLDGHVVQLCPAAVAVRALGAEGLQQPSADLLPGHLHQAQAGDLGDLVPGPVTAEALDQPAQQQLTVGGQHHVDEVDHDDSADVAQPELPD